MSDWLASLPRDREFSIEHAYGRMLDEYPKRAVTKSRASQMLSRSGQFDTWLVGRVRMFRFRGKA